MTNIKISTVTTENVAEMGIYCIKDKKSAGYQAKVQWFQSKINAGLVIKIAYDENNKQVGFIEYLPSELAWRPDKCSQLFVCAMYCLICQRSQTQRYC